MTIDRCPRCDGRLLQDPLEGPWCLNCGFRPSPAVLLGIPETVAGREPGTEHTRLRRREPSHGNKRI